MNKTWKWILGIVLVLVVLAALVFLPILYHNLLGMDYGLRVFSDRDWHSPMMGGRGYFPFGGFMMLGMGLRWFLPLVLIGLLIYGAYRIGKRNTVSNVPPAAPAPTPVRTCPKCGYAVQNGWNNCANCGKKL